MIVSEVSGRVEFDPYQELPSREESIEYGGYREKVIIETRDKEQKPRR